MFEIHKKGYFEENTSKEEIAVIKNHRENISYLKEKNIDLNIKI